MGKFLLFTLPIYLVGLIYLSLPSPSLPSLPNSFKSDEPGDTVQHPDQPAYYTNSARTDVLNYLQTQFAIDFQGYTLPSYRLNYRPEDASQFVREQLLTYYLEEIVHPLRESLFVNGWNPRLSPISSQLFESQSDRWAMIRAGNEYQSKVTLRAYYSPVWARVLIWSLIFPLAYVLYKQFIISVLALYRSVVENKIDD